jgi:hypothetical protein
MRAAAMGSRMMRGSLALLVVTLLASCADGDYASTAGQAPDTAVARFVPGGEVTVVQVTVSDHRPVRGVELVGPGGEVVPAYSIEANPAVAYRQSVLRPPLEIGSGLGFGGGYNPFGTGVGAAVPFGGGYGAPGDYVATSDQVQSTALIRLPDPQDYRQTWRDWTVRIQLGDPPNVTFVMLAAPQPPA